jgi:hypothetical protein
MRFGNAGRAAPALVAVLLLGLPGCTGSSRPDQGGAPAAASSGELPDLLSGLPGIGSATELLARDGTGPDTIALPDTSAYGSLVFTIDCHTGPAEYRIALRTAAGAEDDWISGAECGGGIGESAALDPADLPTALDVTVAEATEYTVYVYGKPPAQVSG